MNKNVLFVMFLFLDNTLYTMLFCFEPWIWSDKFLKEKQKTPSNMKMEQDAYIL